MHPDHPANDYRSISCASYDSYEIAILHHQRLRLVWREGNVVYDQVVTPLNLRTADGAEFLILRHADQTQREVRLDHIRHMTPLGNHPPMIGENGK